MRSPLPARSVAIGLQLGLVAHLAVWVGLLPVSQPLHIALSAHAHRYCSEHQRFEVVPHAEAPMAPWDEAGRDRGPALRGDLASEDLRHESCPLLQVSSSRTCGEPLGARQTAPASPGTCAAVPCETAVHASCPLLARAPKLPPPSPIA